MANEAEVFGLPKVQITFKTKSTTAIPKATATASATPARSRW